MVIGLVMSLVAMAFILPLHWLEEQGAHVDAGVVTWLVLLVPALGGLGSGLVHHLLPAPGSGPGVSRVMYAIHREKSRLATRIGIRKWIAATLTIGSGGSAGAEGPIATMGSVFGSQAGQWLGSGRQARATLIGCGAAAGIASVFNAPIAGVFFTLEVLLRDFSMRTFTPIVVSAVVSAAVTQGFLGNEALFASGADITEDAFTWIEIPNYLLLGLICGSVAPLFVRSLFKTGALCERLPVSPIVRPAIGGLIVGMLGLAWILLRPGDAGSAHGPVPGFMGNGYPVIRDLMGIDFWYEPVMAEGDDPVLRPAVMMIGFLVLIAAVKGVATCITIGSGGAGGVFAPSMFLGAAIGGLFGYVVNLIGLFPSASPAHYALVGMAAMVAATLHAPLTAMLIIYEITRTYEVILPLMLAAVIATIVGRLWYRESVYTVTLTKRGLRLGSMSDLTIMRRLTVGDVPLIAPVFVRPEESAERLLELAEKLSVSDFVVTDADGRYIGMVTDDDLTEALVFREAIPLLQVHELMRDDLPTMHPDDTLDIAVDRFADVEAGSVAVLSEPGSRTVLGLLSRNRLMRHYNDALESMG
ncbi:MAG: chloride channel protein [Phycisphaerales bacterium]